MTDANYGGTQEAAYDTQTAAEYGISRRAMLGAAGGAVVTGLAGCLFPEDDHETGHDDGHDDGHDHDHEGGGYDEPQPSAKVDMLTDGDGSHFAPHLVWIEEGGTVTWHNDSGSHNTAAYHPDNDQPNRMPEDADPWESPLYTEEGETYEHTFDEEGVYDYFCSPHESMGMVGTVLVGHPDPHDEPGLAEPQDDIPPAAREQIEALNEQVNDKLGHGH